MNLEVAGIIAEILAALAVVVSLIYLGYQVRQNSNQLRQQNYSSIIRGALDTFWIIHRDPVAFDVFRRGCQSFKLLSPDKQAYFHSIMVDLLFYHGTLVAAYQGGLLDKAVLDIDQRFSIALLLTPGGKEWWEFAKRTRPLLDAEISLIQKILDERGDDFIPITDLQPWFASDQNAT